MSVDMEGMEVIVRETLVTWRDDYVADLACYGGDFGLDESWALEAYRSACHEGADLSDVIAVLGARPGTWIVGPAGAAAELEL